MRNFRIKFWIFFAVFSVFSQLSIAQDDLQGIEDILATQVNCLRKDSNNAKCRKLYNEYKRRYLRPKCRAEDIHGKLTISDDSEKITEKNISELVLDQDTETGQGTINIKLDSDGTKKLTELTSKHLAKGLEINMNGYVMSPVVRSVIENGNVSVTFGRNLSPSAGEAFKKLCPHPSVAELKPELEI